MASLLTSPAYVTGLREAEERRTDRAYGGPYERFVEDVRQMASAAYADGALVAAADPFVYSNVMTRWRAAIREIAEARPSDAQVLAILGRSDIPLRLYEATRDVLISAQVNGWSTWWTKVQLGRALIPRQPDGVRRSLYRASVSRTARTAATWSTARQVDEWAAEHGAGRHRWVARMDPMTRPSHMAANGQTVPLGQPFEVGGHYLAGPGDPSAPPAETANCRCILVAVED